MTILNIYNFRRGSTFIIVIGILSVLVLIVAALSFSTRMELLSAANYADGVQSRMAAATGLPQALELLNKERRYTSLNEDWVMRGRSHLSAPLSYEGGERRQVSESRIQKKDLELAKLLITDECAKININMINEPALARALTSIFQDHKVGSAPLASSLAHLIVQQRYGKDLKPGKANYDDDADRVAVNVLKDYIDQDHDGILDNPEELITSPLFNGLDDDLNGRLDNPEEGAEHDRIDNDGDGRIDEADEGIDDEKEFVADLRLPPSADDFRWQLISELRSLPGVNDEIFNAVSRYLTPFSASEEIYFNKEKIYQRLNVNYSAVEEIYDALRDYFPDKNDSLLRQFSVNIADFRDTNNVPTFFPGSDPLKPVLGVEISPYIIEIYSDSLTDSADGDDGQFIELYNPYPREMDISGWELVVGSSTVSLNGKISPQGFLIITDDYNEVADPDPEDDFDNYGSFYDIFNVVPNTTTKRLIEDPTLEIPDNEGIVYLRNEEGNLIDYQPYHGGRYTGVSQSFQRLDPRVRSVKKIRPSPFSLPERNYHQFANLRLSLEELIKLQNKPFSSPAELMYLSSGFVDEKNGDGQIWQEPMLKINNSVDKLDSRLIDLFTIAPIARRHLNAQILRRLNADNDPESKKRLDETLKLLQRPTVIGKINVNTASYYALLTLPQISEKQAQLIAQRRYGYEEKSLTPQRGENWGGEQHLPPFKTLSDILRQDDIWENIDELQRLRLFAKWANFITTNSRSFSLVSQSAPIKPIISNRRYHPVSIFALLCLDQSDTPVVYFRHLNR